MMSFIANYLVDSKNKRKTCISILNFRQRKRLELSYTKINIHELLLPTI
jgi:hypothetical protein